MIDQSSINLQQLKLAQDSVSQLFSQINREDTVDHHGSDHDDGGDDHDEEKLKKKYKNSLSPSPKHQDWPH